MVLNGCSARHLALGTEYGRAIRLREHTIMYQYTARPLLTAPVQLHVTGLADFSNRALLCLLSAQVNGKGNSRNPGTG